MPLRRICNVTLLLCFVAQATLASESGRSGFSGNPDTNAGAVCTVCHAPGDAPVPTIQLRGPAVIDAGTLQDYLVIVTGGPAVSAGVGISVSDSAGALEPLGAAMRLLDGELTHIRPKTFSGARAVFPFRYRAPNYNAQVTFFAAANSSDGAQDLLGDGVAATTLTITVQNGFEDPPPPPPPPSGELQALAFAAGFNSPVAIAHAGDERLFVVEQAGVIRSVAPDGSVNPTPFIDISSQVNDRGNELGLLGLAFHPDYASNGHFFVNYTRAPGPGQDGSRISRFSVSADPAVADPGSELVLMEFDQPFPNHNGGDLHFGPDGLLYISSGDGGGSGDPHNYAQSTHHLLGKILRIDVNDTPGNDGGPDCDISGSANYRIPVGNAFTDGPGAAGCDEIFALGTRNPWRFSFDRETGAMWIGDVGQNRFEEINYIPAGAGGGLNFGWRCFEGEAPFDLSDCNVDYLPPVHVYSHSEGGCSVTGGAVYRGQSFPVMDGQYLFSDFCRPGIYALSGPPGDLTVREVLPSGVVAAPSAFGDNAAGELFVADIATGTIYRLAAVLTPGDVDGDGDVDRVDLTFIRQAVGMPADGAEDRRDVNGDGFITTQDVRDAVENCSRPRCAIG